jgi:hypothetical protein
VQGEGLKAKKPIVEQGYPSPCAYNNLYGYEQITGYLLTGVVF